MMFSTVMAMWLVIVCKMVDLPLHTTSYNLDGVAKEQVHCHDPHVSTCAQVCVGLQGLIQDFARGGG